jgi:uncharacterized membrane protein
MGTRAQAIDVARGAALVAMIVYHAAWFATDKALVALDLHALGWHLFQRSIAASFFLLVGVSLALARPSTAKAAGRIARIAACAILVVLGTVVALPGHPLLDWTGIGGAPAPAFDFQPLLPWLGVVLWGTALGKVLRGPWGEPVLTWHSESGAARGLAFLGRHSLVVYMAHVPVLFGITAILARRS